MCAKPRKSGASGSGASSAGGIAGTGVAALSGSGSGAPQPQPVGTPGNPAPNGFTGTVSGTDISDTVVVPDKGNPSSYAGQTWHRGIEIENVMDAQGFRGMPQVIEDDAEFDAAVQAAWGGAGLRMYRGDGAKTQATLDGYDDALKSGDWYVQCYGGNAHGYGFYSAYRYGGQHIQADYDEAQSYARFNGGPITSVKTMTLHPSARIVSEQQVRNEMNAFNSTASQAYNQARTQQVQARRQASTQVANSFQNGTRGQVAAANAWFRGTSYKGPRRGTSAQYQADFHATIKAIQSAGDAAAGAIPLPKKPYTYRDVGVFAAAKGYDAMTDRGTGYMVVLNRTKLIIKG